MHAGREFLETYFLYMDVMPEDFDESSHMLMSDMENSFFLGVGGTHKNTCNKGRVQVIERMTHQCRQGI